MPAVVISVSPIFKASLSLISHPYRSLLGDFYALEDFKENINTLRLVWPWRSLSKMHVKQVAA